MHAESGLSRLHAVGAALFHPLRTMAGPTHRRRPALSDEEHEREKSLPPLGPPWDGDVRWYRGGFPPHAHNAIHPLVHGDAYFQDLLDCLRSAERRVTIAGWCLTPLMALLRGDRRGEALLAEVLREVSERADVYALLWSGAPALFEPNRHFVDGVRRVLTQHAPRVRCGLDTSAPFSHDHHQKAVTVDGRVAYVGGIDLSTFQGDRWDTAGHPIRHGPNWHDVQVRLEGEVVRDVEENFCQRWNAATGDSLQPLPTPPLDLGRQTPAQVIRTIPRGVYPFAPEGEYGIHHAILAAIRCAQRFIYLENQYIWSPEVVDALCEAMDQHGSDPFRIVLVLPARAYTGRYDNDRHVQTLRTADAGRGIFGAYTPYASGPAIGRSGYAYVPVYVHAKVSIVDDQWLSVGSANLNRRGLGTDSEMNVQAVDPDLARALRLELWSEHLGMTREDLAALDPIDIVDRHWRSTADGLEKAMQAGAPPPPGHIVRYSVSRTPVSRLLDLFQDETLER